MSRTLLLRLTVVMVVLSLAAGARAQSQANTGVIEGTVADQTGGALPGARVSIKNVDTNFERVLTTDADGRFRGLLLPLGPYRVTASLQGFGTLVREGINLAVGQAVNLTLSLKVSAVQEEVLVSGDAPVVETTSAEGATRIDSASIRGLPNNGRNFLDFTKLTPGVSIVQGPDGDELTINGQKGIQNNVSVDGADFNNPFFGEQRGGQRPAFTFNLDAVKEVVVVAEGANAEFGRSNGGFVNVVTKSGGNDIHGTVHAFYKNQDIASAPKNPDGSEAQKFDFNQAQAGFTLGGPLQKDKLFYFFAFDYQNGNSTKQTDPTRIDPRLVSYFSSLGSPNEGGSIERTNDARVFLGKLDWQINSKHLATIRYNYTWSEQKNGTFDVDSWGRSANATEKDYSHAVTGSLVSNLSSNALNEFRFQWAREYRPRPYDGPLITGETRPLPDTAMDFAHAYRFGEPFFIPVDYFDERIQFNENLSIIKGRHNFKAGVEFNRVHSNQTFRGFQNGRFVFDSTDGFLNYTRNPRFVECSDGSSSQTGQCPAGTSITGPLLLFLQQVGLNGLTPDEAGTQDIPQTEYAVFFQDKWQPNRKLTVQYGLRWEAQKEADVITPANEVFFAGFYGKTVTNSFGTFPFPSDGTIPSDWNMWQPRLGVSWDPKGDGRTVVRLNAGIFYGRIPGLSLASTRSTNGSRGSNLFAASFLNQFGITPPTYPDIRPVSSSGTPDHPGVFMFDKGFQNPRTYSASVGIERELVPGLAGLVQWNHSKGVHVTRFFEQNDTAFGCPWGTGLGDGGTNGIACGTSGGGGLTAVQSNAKSLYDGITFGLNKRWSHNYQFQFNYTLSWDHSDDDQERDPFTYRYVRYDDLAAEYGYSDRDQRHRLNGMFLWQAPGKVDINFRYSYRSAQPLSLNAAGQVAQQVFGPSSDRIRSDGSIVLRNNGRKDNAFSSFDVRMARAFGLGKSVKIEPILEVFNLFGSKNFKQPSYQNLVFNFDGTIASGLGDARQAQLGARLIW